MAERKDAPMGAYLLIQTKPGHTWEVMRAMRKLAEITRAEIVGGAYDIIAVGSVGAIDHVRALPGVLRALECVAMDAAIAV